jgi:hypothetical protein
VSDESWCRPSAHAGFGPLSAGVDTAAALPIGRWRHALAPFPEIGPTTTAGWVIPNVQNAKHAFAANCARFLSPVRREAGQMAPGLSRSSRANGLACATLEVQGVAKRETVVRLGGECSSRACPTICQGAGGVPDVEVRRRLGLHRPRGRAEGDRRLSRRRCFGLGGSSGRDPAPEGVDLSGRPSTVAGHVPVGEPFEDGVLVLHDVLV